MLVTGGNELKFSPWPEPGSLDSYNMSIESDIQCLSWSRNNAFLIYLEKNGRPEILSLKEGAHVKPIHIITAIDHATTVMFSRNRNKMVAIGTDLATVALYDTRTKAIGKLYDVPGPVIAIDFNVYDSHLAVACRSGKIVVLNLSNNIKVNLYDLKQEPSALRFHPIFEDIFGICTKDGWFFLFDVNETKPLWKLEVAFSSKVNGFAFSTNMDHKEMVTVDEECKFCVYDLANGRSNYKCCLQHPLTAVDYSTDSKHFAVGMDNGTVCIFEARNPRSPAHIIKMQNTRILCMKFANDFRLSLASPCDTPSQTSCTSQASPSVTCLKRTCSVSFPQNNNAEKLTEARAINRGSDNAAVNSLKDEIIADLSKSASQLNSHMHMHMNNLQEFIRKEFDKIELQMDEKWDLMNVVRASCKFDGMYDTSEMLDDTDNPLVIE